MIPKNWKYSRGDIYYANMEPHVGSEQGGERPVVVLQNDTGNKHSPTLIIATLTSRVDKKLSLPTHVLLDQNPGLRVGGMQRKCLEGLFLFVWMVTKYRLPLPERLIGRSPII